MNTRVLIPLVFFSLIACDGARPGTIDHADAGQQSYLAETMICVAGRDRYEWEIWRENSERRIGLQLLVRCSYLADDGMRHHGEHEILAAESGQEAFDLSQETRGASCEIELPGTEGCEFRLGALTCGLDRVRYYTSAREIYREQLTSSPQVPSHPFTAGDCEHMLFQP